MQTHLGTSLALALTLAACSPEVGQESAPISVDPTCSVTSLRLYPGVFYGGTPICLTGNGTYQFPRGFDPYSYQTGNHRGSFHSPVADIQFLQGDQVTLAPTTVIYAATVEIADDGVDAFP